MENKVIFKAGGEGASVQFCPKSKLVSVQGAGVSQEMAVIATNKAVFRAGEVSASVAEMGAEAGHVQSKGEKIRKTIAQNSTKYATPQNLLRGDLAWKVSEDIALLSACYEQISPLNSEFSNTFSDMRTELVAVSVSMRKIAQNLARQPRHGEEQKPNFSTFCEGLSEILVLQKRILTDLRHLQRMAESFTAQIVIIYLTIQAQNETTQTILDAEC